MKYAETQTQTQTHEIGRDTDTDKNIFARRDTKLSTYEGCKGFTNWDSWIRLEISKSGSMDLLYLCNLCNVNYFQECMAMSLPTKLKVLEKVSMSGDRPLSNIAHRSTTELPD